MSGPPEGPARGTSSGSGRAGACDACLRRTWLLGRLAGRIEVIRHRVPDLLALEEGELIAALAGDRDPRLAADRARFEADAARATARQAGLEVLCRCRPGYPASLRALDAPPAVLHVAGGLERLLDLCAGEPVAVVGARRPSDYGGQVARALGLGLSGAGVTVVSGLARGIDTAAHEGALSGAGRTIAVLPGSAHRPYPASAGRLHARIVGRAVAVSELGPGAEVRRWCFRARNRIIAALAQMTVVVEAGHGSGALVAARFAYALGRQVGAVPGRVTSDLAAGPNALLFDGARVVRDAQDVLDHLYGAGVRAAAADARPPTTAVQRALLEALAAGEGTAAALARAGLGPQEGLTALAELELCGYLCRGPGGAMVVLP
jgi:DNA processing protein